ncbi:MAG: crossover junction endodeoxyribonuclease RuvC [Bdellovibrionales bacterium]
MVLGIDPGSLNLGFALLDKKEAKSLKRLGVIEATSSKSFDQRLLELMESLSELILESEISEIVLEEVFTGKNVQSALRLAEVRGAIRYLAAKNNLKYFEYSTRVVKKSITGNGNAKKETLKLMLENQYPVSKSAQLDATDALALAHHHCFFT